MEGSPLGPGGEDITWPDQVALRGRKASSTRKIKPQTSNLEWMIVLLAAQLARVVWASVQMRLVQGCLMGHCCRSRRRRWCWCL